MISRVKGIVFILSAPSGAGKSTLCNAIKPAGDIAFSVSCTTRPPRPGETDGKEYYFVSKEEFERRIAAGEFLEWAPVHNNYYGTPWSEVLQRVDAGQDVLLDIDIQGARRIRETIPEAYRDAICDIFILPPSMAELHRRLVKRGTETAEQIALRLENAKTEIAAWSEYQYVIVTGKVEDDLVQFRSIVQAERSRVCRMQSLPQP